MEIEEEIGVLESIFGSDVKHLPPMWGQTRIKITVRPHMSQSGNEILAEMDILFTDKYPQLPPQVKITKIKGVAEDHVKKLQQILIDKAAYLAGEHSQPFVYDLTQVVDSFLVSHHVKTTSLYEEFKEKQVRKDQMNAEQVKKEQERIDMAEKSLLCKIEKQMESSKLLSKPAWSPPMENHTIASCQSDGNEFDNWLVQTQGTTKSRFLADFEPDEHLGTGGFGKVIKARNRLDGNFYAIKRIRLKRQDASNNRKIRREVTSLAKMFHQHVVRYYQAWVEDMAEGELSETESESEGDSSSSSDGFGASLGFDDWSDDDAGNSESSWSPAPQTDLVLFIQMEYCSGQTLREAIDQGLLVKNPELAWKFFRQLVEALWYVHETCHFIHRDLKPANVFLDEKYNVKLGDFGLAVTADKAEFPDEVGGIEKNEEDITNGVGTTLYRAPEVLTGKYDAKCDMYSLGILLYEMLVPPFSTGMERIRVLNTLRESQGVVDFNLKTDSCFILKWLLHKKPRKRPTALEVLESGKLPRKIETEEKYFNEVMRVVKSADRFSPLYIRLMDVLFESRSRQELFYTFDKDLLEYNNMSMKEKLHRRLLQRRTGLLQQQVCNTLIEAFMLYGAVPFSAPLLTPEIQQEDHACHLMDSQGTVCALPTNLTRPFARWVALRQKTSIKRYDCSNVYLAPGIGGQPRAKLQASLDTIIPTSVLENEVVSNLWHFDHIACSLQGLGTSVENGYIVYVQDFRLQKRALDMCGIDPAKQLEVREILDENFQRVNNWSQLRKHLCKTLPQKQADALRPFLYQETSETLIEKFGTSREISLLKYLVGQSGIKCIFRPWMAPVPEMQTALFFAIVIKLNNENKKKKEKNKGAIQTKMIKSICSSFDKGTYYVGATGGRYCDLIKQYQLSSRSSNPISAIGTRFHVDRIAYNMTNNLEPRHLLVLVAAPSDEEPTPLSICSDLCAQFRNHGISADWVHPYLSEPTIGDTLLDYCREMSIPILINKRKGNTFRLRGVQLLVDKEFQKFEQVLQFIDSKILLK